MHIATEERKNNRYDRFFNSPSASKPNISPRDVFSPFFTGGVEGRVKLNKPSSAEAIAAILNVKANCPLCSQFNQPIVKPAMIHPMVPNTRMDGNSRPVSFICLNDMELTNANVGIKRII